MLCMALHVIMTCDHGTTTCFLCLFQVASSIRLQENGNSLYVGYIDLAPKHLTEQDWLSTATGA